MTNIPEDRVASVGSAKLHYLDWGGDGPLLLLVPGVTGTAYAFAQMAPSLTDRYRVIAMTRRGHGTSEAPPESFDVDLNVDDIATLIGIFTDGPAVVLGHSHGGIEIPRLARRYPSSVTALIFLDAVYEWRKLSTSPPLPGGAFPEEPFSSYEEVDAWFEAAYLEFWSEELRRHAHSQLYTASDGQVRWALSFTGPTFARYLELWGEWTPDDYEGIEVPVLSIQASQEEFLVANAVRRRFSEADLTGIREFADFDAANKRRGLELLLEGIPDAHTTTFDAHHFLPFQQPDKVSSTISSFLAEHSDG